MAEIIDFAEIQEARRKARARIPEREHLERAVQIMRENLAAVAAELAEAPREEQAELADASRAAGGDDSLRNANARRSNR